MRFLFLGVFLFCHIRAFAGILSTKEYNQLSFDKKILVMEAYKEFLLDKNEKSLEEISTTNIQFSFFQNAYADGTFDCLYAGWPSKKSGSKCMNPQRGNSSYPNPSGCEGNQLLCQPVFFGNSLCVNAGTQKERNSAFKNCETKAKNQGRSIASQISTEATTETRDLFSAVESVCTTGFQSSMSMCSKLKLKITEIKSQSPVASIEAPFVPRPTILPAPTIDETLTTAAENAGQISKIVSSAGSVPTECRETPGELNRNVERPDPNVPIITCTPDATSLSESNGEDYSAAIRDYAIEFHPSQEAIVNTRDFRLFMHELKKFPSALLEEMAAAGGKIRVFAGNGVADDPARLLEIERMAQRAQTYWDYWNRSLKNQGVPEPSTAQDVRQSYTITTEGTRNWSTVPGSGGVFTDPTLILPTRVVINKMYSDANGLAAHGATNLVLHEHGHALDSLYGPHSISGSPQWKNVLNDPQSLAFIPKFFSSYERAEEEGFAELFSYYHSCEASRRQLETHAPKIAEFFRNFTGVKDLRPDLYNSWRTRHNK